MPRDLRPLLKKLLANPDSKRIKAEVRAVLKPKRGRPRKIDRDEVARLTAAGLSAAAIAERLGCSAVAVEKIRAGVR